MEPLEERLRAFAQDATGGRVTRLDRSATGSSRVTLLVDVEDADGATRELVVRHDSGDGPLSGTGITLAGEAVVYRALAPHPVRIPRLVAESGDGRTLLVERAVGTDDLAALSPEERTAVERDFGRALAELHAVDPAKLALPGVARPADAADHARLDLARWAGFSRDLVKEPAPFTRFAIDWLGASPPERVERSVLCHGDAGAGNFLHDAGRVTALVDWEFAHLGDPLDDVAWVFVRSHLLGGDAAPAVGAWREASGLDLDAAKVGYYCAFVLLRMAVSCEIALGHAARGGGAMDTTTYQLLLPYLEWLMPQALRRAGCRDAGLDALADAAEARIEAHPVLANLVRPLATL
ncbi:MAG: phosphotransferase family protein [Myxococcota bacterium]